MQFVSAQQQHGRKNQTKTSSRLVLGENIFHGIRDVWIWRSIFFFFFLRGVSHTFYTRMEETMSSATSGRNNGRIEWHLYHAERYRTSSFLFWFLMALAAAAWGSRNNNQMLLLLCIRERWRHRWRMLSRSAILVVGRTVWRECCSRGTGPSTHQTTTPAAHAHTRLLRFFFSK